MDILILIIFKESNFNNIVEYLNDLYMGNNNTNNRESNKINNEK